MARASKCITRAVIGQYAGPDFPVMPTGIMSDDNARLVNKSENIETVKIHLIQIVGMI